MRWDELTWTEIPGVLARCGQAALLPVGATEQHGPHLGCGVDTVVAEQLCLRVSHATGVPMLPPLAYGCSLGHSRRWPGTIALTPVLLIELVQQIGQWAYHGGVRRLFIVNGHVTNAAPLRCALEMLRATHDDLMVAVLNTATLSERVRDFHAADAADWHANDAETSMMMAIAPGIVRPDRVAQADDPDRTGGCVFAHPVNRTSANGVTGTPSLSSAAKGAAWFDWLVEDLADLVRRGSVENPPLDASYFSPAAGDCRH
jgi:creatinine amidohydrolase